MYIYYKYDIVLYWCVYMWPNVVWFIWWM